MIGFVAAWFFPPQTSAEGIVTYKLLKYSKHKYDVCCSGSELWSYHSKSNMNAENINVISINTDDIYEWVEEAFKVFEKRHAKHPYDFVMTRSMPQESVLFGLKVKEKYPQLRWIASFADPIARNPYELATYIDESQLLSKEEKEQFHKDLLSFNIQPWEGRQNPDIQLLCKLARWEHEALAKADHYIFPSVEQMHYTLHNTNSRKAWIIPHSYDPEMIPTDICRKEQNFVTVTYCGLSDHRRSLLPVVEAMHYLRLHRSKAIEKVRFRIVGNTPQDIRDMVLNYHLQDCFLFEKGVDYQQSLRIMAETDWLLHIEAYFHELEGGSIFFASKLADYFGLSKPILGLCSDQSVAGRMIIKAGGRTIIPWEYNKIAEFIEEISDNHQKNHVNAELCAQFDAKIIAELYDNYLANTDYSCLFDSKVRTWRLIQSSKQKLVSICIPSFNAELYLDRCLYTLLSANHADILDIIVVNDGSKDMTGYIAKIYEEKYPGIVRIIDKENGGHGSTINAALKAAKGKYFMVVDSDDWVNSDALDQLLSVIKDKHLNEDVLLTHYLKIDMESGRTVEKFAQNGIPFNQPFTFESIDNKGLYIALANSLFKTSILQNMNLCLQEHAYYDDVEYILLPIPYIHSMRYLDYSVYRYCVGNVNQSINLANMVRHYDDHRKVLQSVIINYEKANLSPGQKKYYRNILDQLLITHYNLCLHDDRDICRGMKRAKEFDEFLSNQDKGLYTDAGRFVNGLSKARRKHFRYKEPINLRVKKGIGQFSRTSLGKKMIYNNFTHKIANSRLIHVRYFEKFVLFLVKNKNPED